MLLLYALCPSADLPQSANLLHVSAPSTGPLLNILGPLCPLLSMSPTFYGLGHIYGRE